MWFMMTHEDILCRTDLGWREKVVYPYLVARQGKHAAAWPSLARIAKDCGSTVSSVRLAIAKLEQLELLVVVRTNGKSSEYRAMVQHGTVSQDSTVGEDDPATVQHAPCRPAAGTVLPGSGDRATGQHHNRKGKEQGIEQGKENILSLTSSDDPPKQRPKAAPQIPPSLDTVGFRAAWSLWQQHRIEIRKKLTPQSIKGQFKKCEYVGVVRAIAMIEHTVTQGWTGLREPKGDTNGGKTSVARIASPAGKYAGVMQRAGQGQVASTPSDGQAGDRANDG